MLPIRFGIALLVVSAMVTTDSLAAPIPDPYPSYKHGLADLEGNQLLPEEYIQIDYKGNGVFLATDVESRTKSIFNRDGEKLDCPLPDGTTLEDIIWRSPSDNGQLQLKKLPDDVLIAFRQGIKIGLSDSHGKVLVEAKYRKIGPVSEDFMFLHEEEELQKGLCSLFNMKTHKVTPLSCRRINEVLSGMSEGIAVVRPAGNPRAVGFVDEEGRVKIVNKYSFAAPFHDGKSMVTVGKGRNWREAVIDKTYKIISPSNMSVDRMFRDHAIASPVDIEPRKFGIVDRAFEFVVSPEYKSIYPVFEHKKRTGSVDYHNEPAFYVARKPFEPSIAFSLTGKILFSFPPGLATNYLPSYRNCTIECSVTDPSTGKERTVYLDLKGEEVEEPTPTNFEFAPGRRLTSTKQENNYFFRLDRFAKFLEANDLIGMRKDKLLSSFPYDRRIKTNNEDSLWFPTSYNRGVRIFFRDNKVEKWCFTRSGRECAPYRQNVVFADAKNSGFSGRVSEPVMRIKGSPR